MVMFIFGDLEHDTHNKEWIFEAITKMEIVDEELPLRIHFVSIPYVEMKNALHSFLSFRLDDFGVWLRALD
jgi:hypothetical protein